MAYICQLKTVRQINLLKLGLKLRKVSKTTYLVLCLTSIFEFESITRPLGVPLTLAIIKLLLCKSMITTKNVNI